MTMRGDFLEFNNIRMLSRIFQVKAYGDAKKLSYPGIFVYVV
jgi:hypothetical protein